MAAVNSISVGQSDRAATFIIHPELGLRSVGRAKQCEEPAKAKASDVRWRAEEDEKAKAKGPHYSARLPAFGPLFYLCTLHLCILFRGTMLEWTYNGYKLNNNNPLQAM